MFKWRLVLPPVLTAPTAGNSIYQDDGKSMQIAAQAQIIFQATGYPKQVLREELEVKNSFINGS